MITGARCLDLYAGTGALGLEAKSRGAASVVLVEQNTQLVEQLQHNVDKFGAGDIHIERANAQHWLQNNKQKFDIVFLDPPFGQGLIDKACALLLVHDCLYPKAWVYIEGEKGLQAPVGFTIRKQSTVGQVHFMLLQIGSGE